MTAIPNLCEAIEICRVPSVPEDQAMPACLAPATETTHDGHHVCWVHGRASENAKLGIRAALGFAEAAR